MLFESLTSGWLLVLLTWDIAGVIVMNMTKNVAMREVVHGSCKDQINYEEDLIIVKSDFWI